MIHRTIYLAGMFLALLPSACVVGPEYRVPAVLTPSAWHSAQQNGVTGALPDSARLARWWQTLNDPLLTRLVEEAAADNLNLRLAIARLKESRARRGLSESERLPTLRGGAGISRSHVNSNPGMTTDVSSAHLDASWELDLFGGKRRALEAATATLEASQEDVRDVQVSLLAEVVLAYVEIRSLQAQCDNARATVAALTELLQITRWRNQAGLASQLDEEQARLTLEQTRAQQPVLQSRLTQAGNNLAQLLGKPPGTVQELQAAAPIPAAPAEVAIGVPAETLRQRPDIRRAERQLAAAVAQVGVAEATRYPDLALSGSLGLQAASPGALLHADAFIYTLAANTAVTIFDGGRLKQQVAIRNTMVEQAQISYQATVHGALRDVENALAAYAEEQNHRRSLHEAVQAAQSAASLADSQYAAGLTDFMTVIDIQRSLLTLQDQRIQSEAAVTSNLARLYKALGGGWNSAAPAPVAPPPALPGDKP